MDPSQLAVPAEPGDPLHQMALQLEAAQIALAETRRTQSEFLWAMGHELRSPLTAVLGYAQLLDTSEPALVPSQKSSLTHILQAGWGLLDLINELMDASLIECGKRQLQMEDVLIEDALRDCEELIKPLARQSNVQVVLVQPEQVLVVAADRKRLRQILMALLSHALLHSGSAGIVRVSCYRCADGRLRVNFQDTSCGKSAAWLAVGSPANHIKLLVSQQLAGYMGGVIATEFIASTANSAGASTYWLELNAAASTP